MKKIILLLIIILSCLGFSENLDKYESKRVFDKNIDMLVTGDWNKYREDPEMIRVFEDEDGNDTFIEWYEKYSVFIKDNKYEVLKVKEKNDESILIVKATYNSLSDISINEQREAFFKEANKILEKLGPTEENIDGNEVIFNVTDSLKNFFKKETKVIQVYMDKENGKWDLSISSEETGFSNDINKELYSTLYPIFEILKEFENMEFE